MTARFQVPLLTKEGLGEVEHPWHFDLPLAPSLVRRGKTAAAAGILEAEFWVLDSPR
jgi:hypothetical protein